MEVEDPSSVKVSEPFTGEFTRFEARKLTGALRGDSALVKFNVNSAGIIQILAGYDFTANDDPVTPLLQVIGTARLAADDFAETKEAVSSRADAAALAELAAIEALLGTAVQAELAGEDSAAAAGKDVVSVAVRRAKDLIEKCGPDFLPMRAFVEQFEGGLHMNRVRVLTRFLETFLDAEEPFACSASFEDAIMLLRSRYRGDANAVVHYAHAHSAAGAPQRLVLKVLDEVNARDATDAALPGRGPAADEAGVGVARGYKEVSYRARQIIVRKQDESRKSRRERMKAIERAEQSRDDFKQESLSDFGLASAGSLYGSVDDLGAMSDVTSDTESAGHNNGAPADRAKRRSDAARCSWTTRTRLRAVQLVREPHGGERGDARCGDAGCAGLRTPPRRPPMRPPRTQTRWRNARRTSRSTPSALAPARRDV